MDQLQLMSRLWDIQVVSEQAGLRVAKAVWRDGHEATDGLWLEALDTPSSADAVAQVLMRKQVLMQLAQVDGVPRLLAQTSDGKALVQSRVAGLDLFDAAPALHTDCTACLQYAISLVGLLEDLHAARIVHGRLGPATLLLDNGLAALGDLEGAQILPHACAVIEPAATPIKPTAFSAPEQSSPADRGVDYRADLYAVGAVLYWLLTGHAPFEENAPLGPTHAVLATPLRSSRERPLAVPKCIADVIAKLLAKEPSARYQSHFGLRADLQHCLGVSRGAPSSPFKLGAADRSLQPRSPTVIAGRAAASARIEAAISAGGRQPRLIAVHGPSGIGKSTLVQSLASRLAARHIIFASGKYEEFGRPRPFGGLAQALNDLASLAMTFPAQDLVTLRRQLETALGPNAPLLTAMVPGLAKLLKPSETPHFDDMSTLRRVKDGLSAVVRVLCARRGRILLFIDDAQWADHESLELIEHLARRDSRGRLLLALAYREGSSARSALALTLDRIRHAGVDVIDVPLDGLAEAEQCEVLADMLDAPAAEVADLAVALAPAAAGNPLLLGEQVRQLFETGYLQRSKGKWHWTPSAVEALPTAEPSRQPPIERLRRLPRAAQMLAHVGACLAGEWDLDMIATVIDVSLDVLRRPVQLLVRHELLTYSELGPTDPSLSGRRFRFSHDRFREAAYGQLTAEQRRYWHLRAGRALLEAAQAPASAGSSPSYRAADHYLAALPSIGCPQERVVVLQLLITTARHALSAGALGHGLLLIAGADELIASSACTAADAAAHGILKYELLVGLGRFDDADEVFEALTHEASAASWPVAIAAIQVHLLLSRGLTDRAAAVAERATAAIGIGHPEADEPWEAVQSELNALSEMISVSGEALLDSLPPLLDERLIAAAHILHAFAPHGHRGRPLTRDWRVLRALRIGWENGAFAELPIILVDAVTVLWARNHFVLAQRLTDAGLRMAQKFGAARIQQRLHLRQALVSSYWIEPLPQALAHAAKARHLAIRLGDVVAASSCCIGSLTVTLDITHHLGAAMSEIERELRRAERAGNSGASGLALVCRQFARCLQGRTEGPGLLSADDFSQAEPAPKDDVHLPGRGLYLTYRAAASALFGDWEAAHSQSVMAGPLMADLGLYPLVLQRWIQGLALCQALRRADASPREELAASLQPIVDWFDSQARWTPENFAHMAQLLVAMKAWADQDHGLAMRSFQASIETSLRHGFPWHHALACELAGRFAEDQQFTLAAEACFSAAIRAFKDWGAHGKAAHLASERQGGQATNRGATGDDDVGVDLAAVTHASHLLAQKREPAELPGVLFELVRHYAGAERGVLFWRAEPAWTARAGFGPDSHWIDSSDPAQPATASTVGIPESVLGHLCRSSEPLVLPHVQHNIRFGRDPVVQQLGIRSIFGLPLIHRGEVVGNIYLENRQLQISLDDDQLQTLRLIGMQFAVAYENALMNQGLERLVQQRTRELELENAERRRAEQAAEAASRAKSEFLANMSHEIRTPINAVLGMSHLALRSGLNSEQANYVMKAERSAQSLLGILNDILDFSKIEAGKLTVESRPFHLGDVLESVANLLGLKADEKGLELLFDLSARLPDALIGDAMRLTQVLVNLGNNAIKFTESGEVVIAVEQVERGEGWTHLAFQVRDSGIGMSPEQQNRLFQPFEQAESSTTRRFGGTGLGLAISRNLVERMGGEIDVQSKLEAGTTFEFRLRFDLAPEAEGRGASLDRVNLLRLLIVDGSDASRRALVAMARSLGMRAEAVASGMQAFSLANAAVLEGEAYDLLLVDVRASDMNGILVAERLAAAGCIQSRPMLKTTALGREAVQHRIDHSTLAPCEPLTKPIIPGTLLEACLTSLGSSPRHVAPEAGTTEPSGVRDELNGLRALLVEDNPINQEFALKVLSDAGLKVTIANNGQQALERLATEPFDCVLMDCQMPVLDGYETTRRIRRDPRWQQLPVIAMTANAMAGDRELALAAGMNDHIAKPINVDFMFATILHWTASMPRGNPAAVASGPADGAPAPYRVRLDSEGGLARSRGDRKLYRRMLVLFERQCTEFAGKAQAVLDSNDLPAAKRMAHDLRGAAALLGAAEVAGSLQDFEAACAAEQEPDTLRAFLRSLDEDLAELLDDVSRHLQATANDTLLEEGLQLVG